MATCQQCFERLPEVHVLAIRGFEFELELGLTPAAQRNLDDATAYLSSRRDSSQGTETSIGGAAPRPGHRGVVAKSVMLETPGPATKEFCWKPTQFTTARSRRCSPGAAR